MRSKNGQLLMCGRIVIQLSEDLESFQNMGVFILRRDFSKIRYEFASLLHEKDRSAIRQQIREDISLIVKFDLHMQPVSPEAEEMRHMMYMVNIIDEFTLGQTSIIKINTKTA